MTLFAIHCRDVDDSAALRRGHLQAHLDHVAKNIARYAVAGPLKDGGATVGSLLIIRAENKEDAAAFHATDPYTTAGVWQSPRIELFSAVAGEWVGGTSW